MKDQVTGYFDQVAPSYDQVGTATFSQMGRRLVELARVPSGGAVLDVATGRGAAVLAAGEQVGEHGQVVGIDLSQEMLKGTAATIERLCLRGVHVSKG